MQVDELRRRVADMVADGAAGATPPPVAVIRRRGRVRRARRGTGMVVLAALVTALAVATWPLDQLLPPAPPATTPNRPAARSARPAPDDLADQVRRTFTNQLAGMGPVILVDEGANADSSWRVAAVAGVSAHGGGPRVCVTYEVDRRFPTPPSSSRDEPYAVDETQAGHSCHDQGDPAVLPVEEGAGREGRLPAIGIVPEGTQRVRLLLQGRPAILVDAIGVGRDFAGPGFRQRFYVADHQGAGVVEVVALDANGQVLARHSSPRIPDPDTRQSRPKVDP